MGGVCRAAKMEDEEVAEEALKAMIEIPEISYEFIGEYSIQKYQYFILRAPFKAITLWQLFETSKTRSKEVQQRFKGFSN